MRTALSTLLLALLLTSSLYAQGLPSSVFILNKGQLRDSDGRVRNDIVATAQHDGIAVFLRNTGLSYVFSEQLGDGELDQEKNIWRKKTKSFRLDVNFSGANQNPVIIADDAGNGYANFYTNTSSVSYAGMAPQITLANIYDGIDVKVYFTDEGEFKYEFIVHPGADPSRILMKVSGTKALALDQGGNLVFSADPGILRELRPVAYTEADMAGNRQPVSAAFDVRGHTVRFDLGDYDASTPLIIDPTVSWSLSLNGSANEYEGDMAHDLAGNLYVVGTTHSANFPTVSGAWMTFAGGQRDGYVAKISPTGSVIWATYYGGSSYDNAVSVDVDNQGGVIVGGGTYSNNIPLLNAHRSTPGSGFLLKLSTSGTHQWSTYVEGDVGSVSVASNGDIALIYSHTGGKVCKYNSSGTFQWAYSTTAHLGRAVIFDGVGSIVYAGHYGNYDCVVGKISSAGNPLWSMNFAGSGIEGNIGGHLFHDLACDSENSVYYVTSTTSNDLPTQSTSFMPNNPGTGENYSGYLAKLSSSGSLLWSTYCGSTGEDGFRGVAVDPQDNVYLGGHSKSTNWTLPNATYPTKSAGFDFVVFKFSTTGTVQYGDYYGTNRSEHLYALCVLNEDNFAIWGDASDITSRDYNTDPTTSGELIRVSGCAAVQPSITASGSTTFCAGGSVTLTASSGYSAYAWSNGASTQSIVVTQSGSYTVYVTDANGCTATFGPVLVTVVVDPPEISFSAQSLDFDDVEVGASKDLTFSIVNNGYCDLTLSSIAVTSGSTDFSVIGPTLPLTIGYSGSTTVIVRFQPSSASVIEKTATISIASNDPIASVTNVAVAGTGIPAPLSPYMLLANNALSFGGVNTTDGDIHSNYKVTISNGKPSTYNGSITSAGKITIGRNNTINGDLTAASSISIHNSSTVTGVVTANSNVGTVTLPALSYSASGNDVTVSAFQTQSLSPGSYDDVLVENHATLQLSSGQYFMNTLEVEHHADVLAALTDGPVIVSIVGGLDISNDVNIEISQQPDDRTRWLTLYSMQGSNLTVGSNSHVYGSIIAPQATVKIMSYTGIKGLLIANKLTVEDFTTVLGHNSNGILPKSSVRSDARIPEGLVLNQNYPNPFNPVTTIVFGTPDEGLVRLRIFDLLGREVAMLVNERRQAGTYAVDFDATHFSSGVFVCQLEYAGMVVTRRMTVLK